MSYNGLICRNWPRTDNNIVHLIRDKKGLKFIISYSYSFEDIIMDLELYAQTKLTTIKYSVGLIITEIVKYLMKMAFS